MTAMATITEQIRRIITESKASRYAIAKAIGVSETLLSRFLTGERGLSLTTLDALADLFGMEIDVGVQKKLPNVKRGKKPVKKKNYSMLKTATTDWQDLADRCAEDAYKNNFSSRRGTYVINDVSTKSGQAICFYNNNPYQQRDVRGGETERFRQALKKTGIKELSYGDFPRVGEEDAGYTYAMLFDATEEQQDIITSLMSEAIAQSRERMDSKKYPR
jgi:transcriptional regulator with XRE-family HTH domain